MRRVNIDDATFLQIERLVRDVDAELPTEYVHSWGAMIPVKTGPIAQLIDEVRALLAKAKRR